MRRKKKRMSKKKNRNKRLKVCICVGVSEYVQFLLTKKKERKGKKDVVHPF